AAAGGMTVVGAIAVAATGPSEQDPAPRAPKEAPAVVAPKNPGTQPPDDQNSPETLRLQFKRRVTAPRNRLDAQMTFYEQGRITLDRFIDASRQLMLAEMEQSENSDQRAAAAKEHRDRITEVVKHEQAELEDGRGTVADVAEARAAQEDAAAVYFAVRQG